MIGFQGYPATQQPLAYSSFEELQMLQQRFTNVRRGIDRICLQHGNNKVFQVLSILLLVK